MSIYFLLIIHRLAGSGLPTCNLNILALTLNINVCIVVEFVRSFERKTTFTRVYRLWSVNRPLKSSLFTLCIRSELFILFLETLCQCYSRKVDFWNKCFKNFLSRTTKKACAVTAPVDDISSVAT